MQKTCINYYAIDFFVVLVSDLWTPFIFIPKMLICLCTVTKNKPIDWLFAFQETNVSKNMQNFD